MASVKHPLYLPLAEVFAHRLSPFIGCGLFPGGRDQSSDISARPGPKTQWDLAEQMLAGQTDLRQRGKMLGSGSWSQNTQR